eukprot:CAMPEP_0196658126 /NCGR_PEP_ID=MMETSP1086-20130531/27433_1 /TAXON_ID=77921 /ORGANISM="Cyanoptyche  gloeocystis , Strain SAG4.97" /LENGTH=319 /DNA_ID=CAMNT_0041991553 /DNA_START=355 /DNA_END=1314 /DNA_ORIENTATION=+
MFSAFAAGAAVYAAPEPPEDGSNPSLIEWNPAFAALHWLRSQFTGVAKSYADPSQELLLPDMSPNPFGGPPPRTLVLDLDDTLIHSEWDRLHGWRTIKRPGADAFLAYMAQFYELVLFSSGGLDHVDPILERLDPHGYITHRLYRDSTLYTDGKHIKDLSRLNRDLSRVIIIDDNPTAFSMQPDNAIHIKAFKGNPADMELFDLVPFLESVVKEDVADVRVVLKEFGREDVGQKFKERVHERQKAYKKQMAAKSSLGALAGLRQGPAPGPILAAISPPHAPAASEQSRKQSLWDVVKAKQQLLQQQQQQQHSQQPQPAT